MGGAAALSELNMSESNISEWKVVGACGGGPSWGLATGPGHLCPCQWLPAEVNHSVIYSKCKPAPSIPTPPPLLRSQPIIIISK